jgi:hypothetical protein
MSESTWKQFEEGDGNELDGKMRALHSSSALGVNIFEYWQQRNEASTIAYLCGLCAKGSNAADKIVFEDNAYVINPEFPRAPNIDVVIHNKSDAAIKRLGIECKFTEAYGGYEHGGIAERYISECGDLWNDIPNLHALAEEISPDDNRFTHLHAAQLIKHTLALKKQCFGKRGFRLLYLWYDAYGDEGALHHDEVGEFMAIAKQDDIMFHELTYQELITKMLNTLGGEHSAYTQYLADRYL